MTEIVFDDPALRIVIWRNVLITHMVETLTITHVPAFERSYRQLTQGHPDGVVALTVLHPNVGVADRPTRQAVTRVMDTSTGILKGQAVVIERSGLLATVLVSAVRAFNMVQKNRSLSAYHRVADAVLDLAPLVAKENGAAARPAELREAVEAVRPPQSLPVRAVS